MANRLFVAEYFCHASSPRYTPQYCRALQGTKPLAKEKD
jgi:hypothetical protein